MRFQYSLLLLCCWLGASLTVSAQEAKIQSFSLKNCIDYGLKHHASVQIEAYNVEQAKQQIRESASSYLPQVNANAEVVNNLKLQQTIIPEGMLGPGSPEQRIAFGTKYTSSMAVQLDQKLFDLSMLSGIKGAQTNVKRFEMQKEQNEEDLIFNIASTYYQILVSQRQLSLLLLNRERFGKILSVTQMQADYGVAKKVDVKQVQVNLNNVASQISNLKNQLEIAKNTLKNYMGYEADVEIVFSDSSRWLNQKPSIVPYPGFNYEATLPAQMQLVKMDLLELQRKTIKFQAVPSLSLYANYGATGFGNDFSGVFDPLLDFSSLGVRLTWSIFTGFRRDAQYKAAVIDLKNAQLEYGLNKSLMNLQYQNAESQSREAKRMIGINQSNMDLAQEVYDNTTLQYREGVASLSDLLNAELANKEAQNNYINSLLNYYLADLGVRKANGTLREYFAQL